MSAVTGPARRPAWYDPDDDRTARLVWSRVMEANDEDGWAFLNRYGPAPALRRLVERGVRDPGVQGRWLVRLERCDPRRDLALMRSFGGRVLIPGDPEWPPGLDDLDLTRPLCLWARGPVGAPADGPADGDSPAGGAGPQLGGGATLHPGTDEAPVTGGAGTGRRAVAVVGARAATYYGRDLAARITVGLADAGFVVISGGAYGIDAVAHRAALAAQGRTVAVMAGGVDRFYPRGNDALLREIAEHHTVLSEVPPGSAPTRWRFLARNRLIAAMASATVVVEAAWRSGAINTAGHARELGRPVGACPGPVSSALSAGCHRLLRQGATCITDAGEAVELASGIGEYYPPQPPVAQTEYDRLDPVQARTYEAVPVRSPARPESIAHAAGLEVTRVHRALSQLVDLDLVRTHGGWFRRAPAEAAGGRP